MLITKLIVTKETSQNIAKCPILLFLLVPANAAVISSSTLPAMQRALSR